MKKKLRFPGVARRGGGGSADPHVDALSPGFREFGARDRAEVAPHDREERLGVGVAVAFHVGEVDAAARLAAVFFEPGEARAEIGAAAALQRDAVRKFEGRVFRGVL